MKIGLALGGGGARGLAHVLALETLDSCGVRPDAIAGTSMGAIIGALYASGRSGAEIREDIQKHIISKSDGIKDVYRKKRSLIKWFDAVSPTFGKAGFLKTEGLLNFLFEDIRADTFEELEIPLQVVATDFHRGEPVVFNSGELLPAVTASMAIPGVFVPVEHEGRVLVDGGVVNNLPYDLLFENCDIVIAIDVAPVRSRDEGKPPNMIEATLGMFDILADRVKDLMMAKRPPTIYIRPTLTGIRILEFDKIETVYEQALPAMQDFAAQLENLLEERSASENLD